MALVAADLATAIRTGMGFPLPNSTQLIGWGTGVVNHIITSGIVANAPGTVLGTAPPAGGPLVSGLASNGLIAGLSGPTLASLIHASAGFPGSVSTQLTNFSTAVVSHIMTLGRVSFSSGTIVGTCSNTPATPGVLTGTGSNGLIGSLNGSTLASAVHSAVGYPGSTSTELTNFCTSLVNYVMTNARVSYALVTGTAPAAGGAIIAGTAAGGTIA